jgi:hypothetical protein
VEVERGLLEVRRMKLRELAERFPELAEEREERELLVGQGSRPG